MFPWEGDLVACRWGTFNYKQITSRSLEHPHVEEHRVEAPTWSETSKDGRKHTIEDNILIPSIWSNLSWILIYEIPNKGTNKSMLWHSKTLQIAFGIAFENWSNGFVIGSKLKHSKYLTSRMQHRRNFFISFNWVKIITGHTGPPRIQNNSH